MRKDEGNSTIVSLSIRWRLEHGRPTSVFMLTLKTEFRFFTDLDFYSQPCEVHGDIIPIL